MQHDITVGTEQVFWQSSPAQVLEQVFWQASPAQVLEQVFWQSSPAGVSPGLLALDRGCAPSWAPLPSAFASRRRHVLCRPGAWPPERAAEAVGRGVP